MFLALFFFFFFKELFRLFYGPEWKLLKWEAELVSPVADPSDAKAASAWLETVYLTKDSCFEGALVIPILFLWNVGI